jgi:hypothetical protein
MIALGIIYQANKLLMADKKECIGMFGDIIMVKYLMDIIFII